MATKTKTKAGAVDAKQRRNKTKRLAVCLEAIQYAIIQASRHIANVLKEEPSNSIAFFNLREAESNLSKASKNILDAKSLVRGLSASACKSKPSSLRSLMDSVLF